MNAVYPECKATELNGDVGGKNEPISAFWCKEGNGNENVHRLIDWVLSPEGQELIEKTGYAGQQNPTCD